MRTCAHRFVRVVRVHARVLANAHTSGCGCMSVLVCLCVQVLYTKHVRARVCVCEYWKFTQCAYMQMRAHAKHKKAE